MEPPAKRARLLSDDSASDDGSIEDESSENDSTRSGGVTLKINSEYAKRYEHNQARAEKHRLEEKYGKDTGAGSDSDSDSDSESEDDDGELATEELDAEIFDTLNAIRNKDPRVYDKQSTFYKTKIESDNQDEEEAAKRKEKPVHLRDYHRRNLLEDAGELNPSESAPPTYADEQAALKSDLLAQMHRLPDEDDEPNGANANDDEDGFLVRKAGQVSKPAKARPARDLDVATADKDPETYLSNFLTSRAWVPSVSSKSAPFESDDEEEDERAEAFEHAFNMRFEDPERANEKLMSHSREAAAKFSVRREDPKGRKKAREEAKAHRDAEKLQREEEKARLRRLKIDEAQEKWMRLKEAAGLKQQHLSDEKLLKFLEQGFEGENWDDEMAKLLGESYYAEREEGSLDGINDEDEDEALATKKSNKRMKKPKWDDDIDIGDLIPDFDEEEERQRGQLKLSDDEGDDDDDNEKVTDEAEMLDGNEEDDDEGQPSKKHTKTKDAKKDRAATKREARLARRKIEALVDNHLATSVDLPPSGASTLASLSASTSGRGITQRGRTAVEADTAAAGATGGGSGGGGGRGVPGFRYRETSPTTHGLSAQEILMASDSQLNEYAGLKKLATFRDAEKKARDRRSLGKKARLREWRRGAFGDARGAEGRSFEEFFNGARGLRAPGVGVATDGAAVAARKGDRGDEAADAGDGEGNVVGATGDKRTKKRKRSKKRAVELPSA